MSNLHTKDDIHPLAKDSPAEWKARNDILAWILANAHNLLKDADGIRNWGDELAAHSPDPIPQFTAVLGPSTSTLYLLVGDGSVNPDTDSYSAGVSTNWINLDFRNLNLPSSGTIYGEVVNLKVQTSSADNAVVNIRFDEAALHNDAGERVYVAGDTVADVDVSDDGLDTGVLTDGTTYYLWLAYNDFTDTLIAFYSLSSTAPTKPAGYDHVAMVGAHHVEVAATGFVTFFQVGKTVYYPEGVEIISAFTPAAASTPEAVDASAVLPDLDLVKSILLGLYSTNGTTTAGAVYGEFEPGVVTNMCATSAQSGTPASTDSDRWGVGSTHTNYLYVPVSEIETNETFLIDRGTNAVEYTVMMRGLRLNF